MKLAIICNGKLNDIAFHKRLLGQVRVVICADGGANHARKLGIVPRYVIGDMDSIDKKLLAQLRKNRETTVITNSDQSKTDTELALELGLRLKPAEIVFVCATGRRLDHSIANIMLLDRVPKRIKAHAVDDKNQIILLRDKISLKGKKGDIVSLIALTPLSGLTYRGLKWGVRNKKTKFGWLGVCNEMRASTASIRVKKGKALVVRARN